MYTQVYIYTTIHKYIHYTYIYAHIHIHMYMYSSIYQYIYNVQFVTIDGQGVGGGRQQTLTPTTTQTYFVSLSPQILSTPPPSLLSVSLSTHAMYEEIEADRPRKKEKRVLNCTVSWVLRG